MGGTRPAQSGTEEQVEKAGQTATLPPGPQGSCLGSQADPSPTCYGGWSFLGLRGGGGMGAPHLVLSSSLPCSDLAPSLHPTSLLCPQGGGGASG